MAQPATPDVSSAAECGGAAPAAAFGTTDYSPSRAGHGPCARAAVKKPVVASSEEPKRPASTAVQVAVQEMVQRFSATPADDASTAPGLLGEVDEVEDDLMVVSNPFEGSPYSPALCAVLAGDVPEGGKQLGTKDFGTGWPYHPPGGSYRACCYAFPGAVRHMHTWLGHGRFCLGCGRLCPAGAAHEAAAGAAPLTPPTTHTRTHEHARLCLAAATAPSDAAEGWSWRTLLSVAPPARRRPPPPPRRTHMHTRTHTHTATCPPAAPLTRQAPRARDSPPAPLPSPLSSSCAICK